MARVPAKMYRKITQHAYTRREYMGGVPALRILQFESGNPAGQFAFSLHLITEEEGQIRHGALEALRITSVRALDKAVGRESYHLRIRAFPHHVLRQNKQASGAGADRVSMGMRQSFGKAIGTAARVAPGQQIVTVSVNIKHIDAAKRALRKCMSKIAMPCFVEVEQTVSDARAARWAEKKQKVKLLEETAPEEPEEEEEPEEGEEVEGEEGAEGEEGTEAGEESGEGAEESEEDSED